ncbi:uncharacterized protein AMSG_09751 [Thecamonas trahens ATCC 50062]|uniref:Uncharacterized protein n=1 Tax=Thecamonas trahens ATCC 50062 TaxID=461836 RepID=A0A0L0DQ06_THETB|nr:hypothetical protein AMSG_09751 [Thecamonas trahens ATCC 50062]KNC54086.1 hypothetical protein AMSG_09751 [Thecamonas trahens ATCC 50062]|eukprot:XP_013754095.1 hypothetical protein AMSG_09751 [Thecamonas trahens ATCC 50062]
MAVTHMWMKIDDSVLGKGLALAVPSPEVAASGLALESVSVIINKNGSGLGHVVPNPMATAQPLVIEREWSRNDLFPPIDVVFDAHAAATP